MRCCSVCPSFGGRDCYWYALTFIGNLCVPNMLATAKFQQYMYGGRPLDVRFNDRWHTFTPTAAKGGQVIPLQPDM